MWEPKYYKNGMLCYQLPDNMVVRVHKVIDHPGYFTIGTNSNDFQEFFADDSWISGLDSANQVLREKIRKFELVFGVEV